MRTGSTLLCASLERTGVAGVPMEYFNGDILGEAFETFGLPRLPLAKRMHRQLRRVALRRDWAVSTEVVPESLPGYLDRVVQHRTTSNGVFALKLHWHHYLWMRTVAGLPIAALPQPVSWVYVERRNRLAQAVSLARARQSGQWAAGGRRTGLRERQPSYDEAAISRALGDVDAHTEGWRRFFAVSGIVPVTVVYEDLAADPSGTVARVLGELGLSGAADWAVPLARQADATSQDWIERYSTTVLSRGH